MSSIVERTDDTILTDDEVYQLKGGDANFIFKTMLGFGAVGLFLVFTKRVNQVMNFDMTGIYKIHIGGTFVWCNAIFFGTASTYQFFYNRSRGLKDRLDAHNAALQLRFINNLHFMKENRKKPMIH